MNATNLNPLFIDLIVSYAYIIQSIKPITKEQFKQAVIDTVSIREPRNALFIQSIDKSEFETIRLSDDRNSILFNQ